MYFSKLDAGTNRVRFWMNRRCHPNNASFQSFANHCEFSMTRSYLFFFFILATFERPCVIFRIIESSPLFKLDDEISIGR